MSHTFEPFDTFHPEPDPFSLHTSHNLLRECLPYLRKMELSPSTSPMLRALIADIEGVTLQASRDLGRSLCQCRQCLRDRKTEDASGWPAELTRMILCTKCGNKRCPHATDHRHECTGSNEPGQKGSAYENCVPPTSHQKHGHM